MVNNMMNNRPVKNVGNENPMKEIVVAMLSKNEYCFTAPIIPTGIASKIEITYDVPIIASVTGSRA